MIPMAEPQIGKKEMEYVQDCVKSTWISSSGRYVGEFEEKFAAYCGAKYGVSSSNGTTALHLALAALGLGPGDEVIAPTLSFIATANAVRYCGAKPVFVDSRRDTWDIDHEKIEKAITEKTKAIIPVHLYGLPADMDPILEIAQKHGLPVIEDAAEAHGAEYKGRKTGGIGTLGCFSFYGNKIITTGEGGMVLTNDAELKEKLQLYKNHGMSKEKKYWHPVIGFNYRMTNIQAALGVAQLERIEQFIEAKRKIAKKYSEILSKNKNITLPPEPEWAKNVYWMYTILLEKDFGMDRNQLVSKLKKAGIDSRPFFYPSHVMPPYKGYGKFPVAEEIAAKGISLPSGVNLTDSQLEKIANEVLA